MLKKSDHTHPVICCDFDTHPRCWQNVFEKLKMHWKILIFWKQIWPHPLDVAKEVGPPLDVAIFATPHPLDVGNVETGNKKQTS